MLNRLSVVMPYACMFSEMGVSNFNEYIVYKRQHTRSIVSENFVLDNRLSNWEVKAALISVLPN